MGPDRGLEAEMASPKYAHLELERRWLVDRGARPALDECDHTLIEDRYLERTRMRLRRMSAPGGTVLKLSKKYESERPEARPVVTAYLTEGEYALLARLPARELRKRRFRVRVGGLTWSVDVFEGPLAGLELAEIEAPDEAALTALVPPPWLAREVTHDPRYQCGTLAQTHAFPE